MFEGKSYTSWALTSASPSNSLPNSFSLLDKTQPVNDLFFDTISSCVEVLEK
jgi:hypothetical protein